MKEKFLDHMHLCHKIPSEPILRKFGNFKETFKTTNYLKLPLSRLLSKIRHSPISIEVGSFLEPPSK